MAIRAPDGANKINKLASKFNKIAPIQSMAPKINKMAQKINEMEPIQCLPQCSPSHPRNNIALK